MAGPRSAAQTDASERDYWPCWSDTRVNLRDGSRGPAKLLSQDQASDSVAGWRKKAFNDVASRLGAANFPCIFSRNALKKGLLKFIFVENINSDGIEHLAEGLTDYVELSTDWDGRLDTAYPLVVAFHPDAYPNAKTVADYHAFGWRVLQELHHVDPAPWPSEVSTDPHASTWSMCFNGMQLFCNMSNPGHRVRRSRNLGEHFTLIINPRERFDVFAGETPRGRNARTVIRKRIHKYDGTAPSLQLGSFGHGGIEWLQYGLIEEQISDSERADVCPFTFKNPSE